MANKKDFIIDIVPLTKIPLTNNQSFSYLSEKKISAGSLVSIPLFRRNAEGIVLGAKKDFPRLGNIELKKIGDVTEENFLTSQQLELAKFISDYYISPLGVVMKNFVPKRANARNIKHETYNIKQKKIILTKEQQNIIKEITKKTTRYSLPTTNYLLFGPAGSGKTEIYIHSMLKLKKANSQFLVLLPEKTLTPQALERYGAYFKKEEIAVISSNISKGQFYTNWQRIKSGEAKVIIGTRMAVFAPFKKLELIVIDEEQDMSYKQWDMNPRYDARTVAEKLAEIHQCRIIRGSATPSVETYWRAQNKELKLLKLPSLKLPGIEGKKSTVTVVDMKKERWDKNFTSLSKKLKSEIAYAFKYNQQVILFINRQGMSSFSVCEACKTVLKCLTCDRALTYEKSGSYKCNHCSYKTDIFPKCVHCGGINFKNVGLGTQKVEKEIREIFPSARIIVADTDASKQNNFQENLYQKFSQSEADILIGTQMITKGWDLPKVSVVGIVDADNLLSFPDFLAEEKAFQAISQVAGRVSRPGAHFPGEVIIQTFQPENEIIKLASENNFDNFFEKNIFERKSLNLPPIGRIIKLIFQDYDFKKVQQETQAVFKALNKLTGIKISEPHSPLLSKIRGRFREQIIIKFTPHQKAFNKNGVKNGSYVDEEKFFGEGLKNKIPVQLEKELKKLGSGWIIDRDPISII